MIEMRTDPPPRLRHSTLRHSTLILVPSSHTTLFPPHRLPHRLSCSPSSLPPPTSLPSFPPSSVLSPLSLVSCLAPFSRPFSPLLFPTPPLSHPIPGLLPLPRGAPLRPLLPQHPQPHTKGGMHAHQHQVRGLRGEREAKSVACCCVDMLMC
jgi:hypothetical protein